MASRDAALTGLAAPWRGLDPPGRVWLRAGNKAVYRAFKRVLMHQSLAKKFNNPSVHS